MNATPDRALGSAASAAWLRIPSLPYTCENFVFTVLGGPARVHKADRATVIREALTSAGIEVPELPRSHRAERRGPRRSEDTRRQAERSRT
jgi:hypothetical protein